MRLFASNIKNLQQERIRAPSCGWTGEGETLQTLCFPQLSPMSGVGGAETGENFTFWGGGFLSLLYKHVQRPF